MAERLTGKIAMVTGGGAGSGRATAQALSRDGATVVVSDVEEQGGTATVDSIKAAGGQALFVRADVSQAEHVEELVERTVAEYGRRDCAFNNAFYKYPISNLKSSLYKH